MLKWNGEHCQWFYSASRENKKSEDMGNVTKKVPLCIYGEQHASHKTGIIKGYIAFIKD